MCRQCEWEEYLEKTSDMLMDEDYEFAHDTLNSISKWIEENEHVTDKQADAVDNIENSIDK